MLRNWMKAALMPVMAFGLVIAGCENLSEPTPLTGPSAAEFAKKAKKEHPGKGPKKGAKVKVSGKNGKLAEWILGTGTAGEHGSVVVYPGKHDHKGEWLTFASGHALFVPQSAVLEPTTFYMTAVNRTASDGQEYYALELTATVQRADGETSVGDIDFLTDVYLYMVPSAAGNYDGAGDGATILWAVNDKVFKPVECRVNRKDAEGDACVTAGTDLLVAKLKHFSDYAIGFPN